VPVAGGPRAHCVDLVQLRGFLLATQPELVEIFALDTDGPTRRKFLARLQGEVGASAA
jgi:type I restriction enzyme R subunit